MPFKQTPRVLYGHSPLHEVICQIRYQTILRIGTEPPAQFQEDIRDTYPLYERARPLLRGAGQADVSELLARLGVPLPVIGEAETHQFTTEDRKRSVSLTTDFLAIADQDYDRWEHFRARLERIEKSFRSLYHPARYVRVGLRYRDVIVRSTLGLSDRRWRDLISPAILGELGDPTICDRVLATQRLTTLELTSTKGQVNIRHGLAEYEGEQCYVIDSDFFTEERKDSNECFATLDIFNRLAGNLFRWAISKELHDAMGPQPLEE